MPAFTRTNGGAAPMEQVGRDLFFKTFTRAGITQANLDALVQELQGNVTITAIGAFTANTAGSVNMIIEGADVTANVTISGHGTFVTSNMSF